MLVGMISDVHSNLTALRAVLSEMGRLGVSCVLGAGDLVGYYTFPDEVLELLAARGVRSIAGNHDRAVATGDFSRLNEVAAVAARWTAARIAPASRAFLERLPRRHRLEVDGRRVLLVHGSPRDDDEYVYPLGPDAWPFGELDVDVLVMGHTHVQWEGIFGDLLVVNPGSVGQPRDSDPRAAFATLDTRGLGIRLHRVDYDRAKTASAVAACGLPARLSERLHDGS